MVEVGRAHPGPYVVLEGPTTVGRRDGSTTLVPPSLQPLLTLICLSPEATLGRQAVLTCLWPDVGQERSRARLSTALWRLRGLLVEGDDAGSAATDSAGGDNLLTNPPPCPDADDWRLLRTVDLHAIDWTDPETANLRRRVERAALRNPQDLAQGCEHEWVVDQRAQLELASQRALTHLVEVNADLDLLERAIMLAEALTERDELREDGHRWLMRLYARAGRRADALRRFDRCREALRAELEVEPMAETVELADVIRQGRRFEPSSPSTPVSDPSTGWPVSTATVVEGEAPSPPVATEWDLGLSLSLGDDADAIIDALSRARRALADVEAALRLTGESVSARP